MSRERAQTGRHPFCRGTESAGDFEFLSLSAPLSSFLFPDYVLDRLLAEGFILLSYVSSVPYLFSWVFRLHTRYVILTH